MYAILRTVKLKSAGNIGGLNSHLERTMEVPNADLDLKHKNHRLIGSGDLVADVQKRIEEAGITPRKNAVLAVEHLMSCSAEFFSTFRKVKMEGDKFTIRGGKLEMEKWNEFINISKKWLCERYGRENVVGLTLHMDEKTPHLHGIVVPIDKKGKLNCRSFLGGRQLMSEMQTSFASKVEHLGLERGLEGSKAKHTTLKEFYSKIEKLNPELQIEIDRKKKIELLNKKAQELINKQKNTQKL